MSESYHFTIPGPVAPFQKRTMTWNSKDGRFGTLAHNAGAYAGWKPKAQAIVAQAWGDRPLLNGALILEASVYFPIPQAWSEKKKRMAREGLIRPTRTPDWDNAGKSIGDCLTKIVIEDDKLIVEGTIRKYYDDKARVEIILSQWQFVGTAGTDLFDGHA